MQVEVRGVHYNVTENTREHINKHLEKLTKSEDYIVDFHVTIKNENNMYSVLCDVHFRWGDRAHIAEDDFELFKAIDALFEKVLRKIKKEKEKVRRH